MPELTITSPYGHSRVNSNTFTMGIGQPYARVDLSPMPESTLSPSQGLGEVASGHFPSFRLTSFPAVIKPSLSHFPFFLFRSFAVAKNLFTFPPFLLPRTTSVPAYFPHFIFRLFLLILSLFSSCLSPYGVSFFSIKYLEGRT
jgi:hypothetical protein